LQADLLIKGGTIIDPARGMMDVGDIAVKGSRIAATSAADAVSADIVVDASGCLVAPGLIDHHAHVFHGGTALGVAPDVTCLPMGVTTVVDAGSAGVDSFETFVRSVVAQAQMRVLGWINISSEGMVTKLHAEDLNPEKFDGDRLGIFLDRYKDIALGLKIRCGAELVGEHGLNALSRTLEMAREFGCPVNVHVTNPPGDLGDLAEMLRPGDVICHAYQGTGSTILNADGRIKEKILAARRRGVLFDTADGRGNHSQQVIKQAVAQGFYPDIISTDLVKQGAFRETLFGLPLVMSKYLAAGLPLNEVVRACTETPAKARGLAGTAGTLAPGTQADIAIFSLEEGSREMHDRHGNAMTLPRYLFPQMTVLKGEIVFRQLSFF
jgi:predicted amidohydrolase